MNAAVPSTARGTVPFGQHRTWYRITGATGGARPAVVVVHGGPGSTHDYLLSLVGLADRGWPVVHYDQLGNGGSTHLPGAASEFWTVDLFLAELANLLRALDITQYVLCGHSWGGMLAAAHAATAPAGLRGLVVVSSPASYPLWTKEMAVLRAGLPTEVAEVLDRHEAAGTTDDTEYQAASAVFYDRHVCRVKPWPRDYRASFFEIYNDPTVYYAMNGPTEFHVVGSLRDWSVTDLLPSVTVPTLVLSGEHDEATPAAVRPYEELVPDVRWDVVEGASHLPHLEAPEQFFAVLERFLEMRCR
jgi:L-proline amide hydrolase